MATLMTFKSASGKTERCDARCHDAKNDKCVCCCGGRNHGEGFVKAFENTINHFDEILKEAKNIKDPKLKITCIKQNQNFIRYFDELKRQQCLFGKESKEQLLARVKNVKL